MDVTPLTKEQAQILTAFTGINMCINFGDAHEYMDTLIPGVSTIGLMLHANELKELAREDFMKLVYKGNR